MYVCEGCMLAATFACIFVLVAYRQLRLHVCLCRLHVVDGYICVYVGDAGCMSAAMFACTFVQVAYLQLLCHVRLSRLHVATCACMYVGDRMFDDTFAHAMVLIACWKVHVHWRRLELPAAIACTLVKLACWKARLLLQWCRLDVASCVGMFSGRDDMFEGTFACSLVQIGCYQLSLHVRLCRLHLGG